MILPLPSKVLNPENIEQALESACTKTSASFLPSEASYSIRPAKETDIPTIHKVLHVDSSLESAVRDTSLFHGIVLETQDDKQIFGCAICYFAYSTWDSRFIYLNAIRVNEEAASRKGELCLMLALAHFALELDCQRLVWQHYENKSVFYKEIEAEILEGWLTLRMDRDTVNRFLATKPDLKSIQRPDDPVTDLQDLVGIIDQTIQISNVVLEKKNLRLHRAGKEDLEAIATQVQGLAIYEKETDSVHVTKDHYEIDGFSTDTPLFHCLLLQDTETSEFHGMAFFYFGYDMNRGRFLYLEDLFIEKVFRGKGGGGMAMYTLANICASSGCTAFVWQTLDWNPALFFYKSLGAKVQDGLITTRFNTKDELNKFITSQSSST